MKTKQNGFTLIEIMMVMIIISLILTPLMYWYSLYEQQRKIDLTKDRVAMAYQKLSEFKKFYNFYPLPAGLETQRSDYTGFTSADAYGRSAISIDKSKTMAETSVAGVRTALLSIGSGSCGDITIENGGMSKKICVQESARIDTDVAPVSDVPAAQRRVIIGTVPFRDLNIKEAEAYDAYGSRLVYAVSYPLTARDTFKETLGMIKVVRQDGSTEIDLSNEKEGSFQLIVFSVGRNKNGGYTMAGLQSRDCINGNFDTENCDFLGVGGATSASAKFAFDAGSRVAGTEFDDVLALNTTVDRTPWITGDNPEEDIVYLQQNRPVAIGNFFSSTLSNPWKRSSYKPEITQGDVKLQVGLGAYGTNFKEDTTNWSDGMAYVQNKVIVNELCDPNSGKCMKLDKLVKTCPPGQYVTGIGLVDGSNPGVRCKEVYFGCIQNAQYLKGVNSSDRTALCGDIPPPAQQNSNSNLSDAAVNAIASAISDAILAHGGTISDAVNAVGNAIIAAGGSAEQLGKAIGRVVDQHNDEAGGKTGAGLALDYVLSRPAGTMSGQQQVIAITNAAKASGLDTKEALVSVAGAINGKGGSANQVAAVVGQAATVLNGTAQLRDTIDAILDRVYGGDVSDAQVDSFNAAVRHYAGSATGPVTGTTAGILDGIGSNGSGSNTGLTGMVTLPNGANYTSGISNLENDTINTSGSLSAGLVAGGIAIIGSNGLTTDTLNNAAGQIADLLDAANVRGTTQVTNILNQIASGTSLSGDQTTALSDQVDRQSSSIDLASNHGGTPTGSSSGGGSGSSTSNTSNTSSSTSSNTSVGEVVTCNTLNIDRSKFNYCDDRAESYKQVGTGTPAPPMFSGACLLGVTAGTSGECGDRQYRLALQNQCSGGTATEVFAQTPTSLAAKIDGDLNGCCAYRGPGDYTDRYEIPCRTLAENGGTANFSAVGAGLTRIMQTESGGRGLTRETDSLPDYDTGTKDHLAYKTNESAIVTRKMNKTNCAMDVDTIDWSNCTKRDINDLLPAEQRWWDLTYEESCTPVGGVSGSGYRPFQKPQCVSSIDDEASINNSAKTGKFKITIGNYGFDYNGRTGDPSSAATTRWGGNANNYWKNCIPKDLPAWSTSTASLIQSSVDRVDSIPMSGIIQAGGTCSAGELSRCQVSVGAGKYDTYKDCKCEMRASPRRKMTTDEMTILLTMGSGACSDQPPSSP